jgi:alkylmercury lyase
VSSGTWQIMRARARLRSEERGRPVMNTRTIEVLSFEGCPHVDLALRRAREAVRATGLAAEVVSIIVDGPEEAVARQFLGSPSIRVDGIDVAGAEATETEYGMRCRVYPHEGRMEGAPSVERIVAALTAASLASQVDFAGLAGALAPAFPRGSERLFVAIVRLLAEGAPVSRTRLASTLDVPLDELAKALTQIPSIEYEDGEIVGAALSIRETPHALEIEGRRLYTWCALDALFIPALIDKPCRVTSPCPATGGVVRLEVTADAVVATDPAGAAVSIVMGGCSADLRRSFCDGVRFFVSAAAAADWVSKSGGAVISVHEAFRLGAAIARHLRWQEPEPRVFACTLPPAELRQRRVEVLASVRRRVSRIEETADGFVFTFARSPELLLELEEFVRFEAVCCSFISMQLLSAGNELELRMSAPQGAKAFIQHELIDLPAGSTATKSSSACGCKPRARIPPGLI